MLGGRRGPKALPTISGANQGEEGSAGATGGARASKAGADVRWARSTPTLPVFSNEPRPPKGTGPMTSSETNRRVLPSARDFMETSIAKD